jgi:NAD(P)-dependent dehydrogenase (short-subunit alcohol dehydrogenase family)
MGLRPPATASMIAPYRPSARQRIASASKEHITCSDVISTPSQREEAFWWQGGLYRMKARAAHTGGSLGLHAARIIVTGPASGIGKEITHSSQRAARRWILACRDPERGKQTAEEIRAHATAAQPVVIPVDTSSPASIREFAREYRRRFDRLDALVNNAGVLRPQRETSVGGLELTFATNVIGYYVMTRELLDILRTSAPARVVNVASTLPATWTSRTCSSNTAHTTVCRLMPSPKRATACSPGFLRAGSRQPVSPPTRSPPAWSRKPPVSRPARRCPQPA